MEKYIISKPTEYVEIIKKSKFICLSFSITNKEQTKDILEKLRKEYKDATHICFAYSLKNGEQKFSDDGEPKGTAGKPMLDCINKQKIVDCLVVIIRYFGGVKLGAGGLLRSYVNLTSKVLMQSEKQLIS